jgi:inner membrane transporter RhtA
VLQRVPPGRFAVLLAILPLTAALIGALALGQVPRPLEALGILAVVAALALVRDASGRPPATRLRRGGRGAKLGR